MKKICFLLISGSIAAIKAPKLVRELQAKNFEVHCVLTKSAREFITPRTLAAISKHPVLENEWWTEKQMKPGILAQPEYEHLDFAKKADLLLIAPATADTLSRIASGRANGLFEATVLASNAPLLIAPAMNSKMLLAEKTQKNIAELKKDIISEKRDFSHTFLQQKIFVLPTKSGKLACGEEGKGKMLESKTIALFAKKFITPQTLVGKKIIITLGATEEMFDPVRCITNCSSGKMGYSIALQAFLHGAEVTIIAGKNEVITHCASDNYKCRKTMCSSQERIFKKIFFVTSAQQMLHTTQKEIDNCDYAFFAAAVCDFVPERFSQKKLDSHQERVTFSFRKTSDIAAEMGKKKKKNQQFFGFALQTGEKNEAEKKAREKMKNKNLDGIFLNTPANIGAENGEIFFLQKNKKGEKISGTKMKIAEKILTKIF